MVVRVHGKIPRTKRSRTRLLGAVQMVIGLKGTCYFSEDYGSVPSTS